MLLAPAPTVELVSSREQKSEFSSTTHSLYSISWCEKGRSFGQLLPVAPKRRAGVEKEVGFCRQFLRIKDSPSLSFPKEIRETNGV